MSIASRSEPYSPRHSRQPEPPTLFTHSPAQQAARNFAQSSLHYLAIAGEFAGRYLAQHDSFMARHIAKASRFLGRHANNGCIHIAEHINRHRAGTHATIGLLALAGGLHLGLDAIVVKGQVQEIAPHTVAKLINHTETARPAFDEKQIAESILYTLMGTGFLVSAAVVGDMRRHERSAGYYVVGLNELLPEA